MKVCDVVKNSVWFDPRVRKQIDRYIQMDIAVVAVGVCDLRYCAEEVEKLPCEALLSPIDGSYYDENISILKKIIRELRTNRDMYRNMCRIHADIIHANDLNALVPAYLAAKKTHAKVIYDSHEIFVENPWINCQKAAKFIWKVLERFLIKRVDQVVCVSHAAADYLAKVYAIPTPMVVTNCVSQERITDRGTEPKTKDVLNHGQYSAGRGYDILVNTAPFLQEYADLRVVLRGFGPLEEALRKTAADNHSDNVVFAPPVKVYELVPKAAEAWVGIAITEPITVNYELSVSNKLFEYAAAGLPVILSDIPEHRYLNDKFGFGILLEDNKPETVAKAIRTLYEDPALYARCRENAYRLAQTVNWENEFQALIEAEEALIS